MLPTGIIIKLRRDQHGQPARYKACLVARGSLQPNVPSVAELYTFVVYIDLVRDLLAMASMRGWNVEHVEIKGTFMYAHHS